MQNKAVFYCGTNGAGKSTLRSLDGNAVSVVIDSDHIAMQINPANPRAADIEAGRKAIGLFRFAIENSIDFSMESTLSGKSALLRMAAARNAGFSVRLNYIGVKDPLINIARVKARTAVGGHFIPSDTISKRYKISLENLPDAVMVCDETMIYDNSGEYPDLIFHIERKQISVLSDTVPKWCSDLYQILLQSGFTATQKIEQSGETP